MGKTQITQEEKIASLQTAVKYVYFFLPPAFLIGVFSAYHGYPHDLLAQTTLSFLLLLVTMIQHLLLRKKWLINFSYSFGYSFLFFLLVTVIIHYTGGVESLFIPLLLVAVAAIPIVYDFVKGLRDAFITWAFLGLMVFLEYTGWLSMYMLNEPSPRLASPELALIFVLQWGFLFVVVAVMVGQLSDGLKAKRKEAELKTKKMEEYAEELRKLKEALEVKVAERTKELEEKVQKLDHSQKAMLYMVEDLNQTSQELKTTRDRVVRSEKLAAIGKLAAMVAHEIRNPLGVIRNSIYILNLKLKEGMDEKIKKHLNLLQSEINNADKIVSDILDFSRIKVLALTEIDINDLVREALSLSTIPEMIKVQAELGADLPKVKADPQQLEVVFSNLILNAVQAMPEGGNLKITTSQAGKFITIAFQDTGYGIPRENLNKIFEPLFSTKARGTGLGLSTCQNIIEGHQGKIEAESEMGKGTTFTVKLPRAEG